uniref:Uncharacterized protein n=1 Tax=Anguilla anguilla TaxID=7936 RepID=A0A0E9PY84_ANGAN
MIRSMRRNGFRMLQTKLQRCELVSCRASEAIVWGSQKTHLVKSPSADLERLQSDVLEFCKLHSVSLQIIDLIWPLDIKACI